MHTVVDVDARVGDESGIDISGVERPLMVVRVGKAEMRLYYLPGRLALKMASN